MEMRTGTTKRDLSELKGGKKGDQEMKGTMRQRGCQKNITEPDAGHYFSIISTSEKSLKHFILSKRRKGKRKM